MSTHERDWINSDYVKIIKAKLPAKIHQKLLSLAQVSGIHPKYIAFAIDKKTNEPLFSLHYTFFINKVQELGLLDSYSLNLTTENGMVKCTFRGIVKDKNTGETREITYELYNMDDSSGDQSHESKERLRSIIMLQKTTVLNAIKFFFPEIYMEYSSFNVGNPYYWNNYFNNNNKNIQNANRSAPNQSDPSPVSAVNREYTKPTQSINDKYRRELQEIMHSYEIPHDEFRSMLSDIMRSHNIVKMETEEDYQKVIADVLKVLNEKQYRS